jgi:hypothetical protein
MSPDHTMTRSGPDARPPGATGRRARLAVTAATALALAVLAGGCGSSATTPGKESAADFVKRVTLEFSRGQSGRLWDELVPADQAIVSRAKFVTCEGNEGFGLQTMQVLDSYDDPTSIAGKSQPATAVTLKVTADDGTTTATMHAIPVNGSWRWTLQPAEYAAYTKGKCP